MLGLSEAALSVIALSKLARPSLEAGEGCRRAGQGRAGHGGGSDGERKVGCTVLCSVMMGRTAATGKISGVRKRTKGSEFRVKCSSYNG